jgi:diguanylate cyclase (GGDEF)-like protein
MSRVLVIDDASDIHDLVDARIRQGGEEVEVLHALDAESGIRLAREQRPDAILLDLDIPGRNGFEICRELARDPRLVGTPIIFLTGTVDIATKVSAFEAGASDYVTKPFDGFELRARVRAALRTTRYRHHLERAARQRATLLELSGQGEEGWIERLRRVLREDAATLDVERVSYWQLTGGGDAIECVALVRRSTGEIESGQNLDARQFPGYFHALRTAKPVVANDANAHPDTREFSESYLVPAGIGAMMDVPVFVRGELVGVVCHEHVGGVRVWEPDEVQFAVSMGHMLSLAIESEHRRRAEEILRHTALHDALTGLPNRVLLFDILRRELGRMQREPAYGFAVVYFDLDAFKPVNDVLGHEVGDALLASVAQRVRDCLRPMDAVARIGGDEFVAVVAGTTDAAEVEAVAARLEAAMAAPHVVGGREIRVGASIGIAIAGGALNEPSALLRAADEAMFRKKRARAHSRP